ncbi:MAG: hypothetical protein K6C97_12585 [Treponema sp.]|nr:hypothetical protein [Treponema sp.]
MIHVNFYISDYFCFGPKALVMETFKSPDGDWFDIPFIRVEENGDLPFPDVFHFNIIFKNTDRGLKMFLYTASRGIILKEIALFPGGYSGFVSDYNSIVFSCADAIIDMLHYNEKYMIFICPDTVDLIEGEVFNKHSNLCENYFKEPEDQD